MCLNSSSHYGLTDFKQNGCTTCVPATPTGLQLTVELAPSVGAALWTAQRGWGAFVVDGDTALAALVGVVTHTPKMTPLVRTSGRAAKRAWRAFVFQQRAAFLAAIVFLPGFA